jgi:hypothetical protein
MFYVKNCVCHDKSHDTCFMSRTVYAMTKAFGTLTDMHFQRRITTVQSRFDPGSFFQEHAMVVDGERDTKYLQGKLVN